MKKTATLLTLAFLLAGCSEQAGKNETPAEVHEEAAEQKKATPVAMQLLNADEENGVTLENEMYQQLDDFLNDNPNIGVADDFSVHPLTLANQSDAGQVMFFLGINRLDQPIKNITFDYSLGMDTAEGVKYALKNERVELLEPFAGTIQPGHAIPFTVPITPEGAERLQSITEDNKVVELENADFELVK